jgi:hypothetical protein
VVREGVERLLFVLKATTFCAVAELRVALKLGAKIKVIESQVFTHDDHEQNHDAAALCASSSRPKPRPSRAASGIQSVAAIHLTVCPERAPGSARATPAIA